MDIFLVIVTAVIIIGTLVLGFWLLNRANKSLWTAGSVTPEEIEIPEQASGEDNYYHTLFNNAKMTFPTIPVGGTGESGHITNNALISLQDAVEKANSMATEAAANANLNVKPPKPAQPEPEPKKMNGRILEV